LEIEERLGTKLYPRNRSLGKISAGLCVKNTTEEVKNDHSGKKKKLKQRGEQGIPSIRWPQAGEKCIRRRARKKGGEAGKEGRKVPRRGGKC